MALGRRAVLGSMGALPVALARAGNAGLVPTALTMATGEPGGGFAVYGQAWGLAAQTETRIAVSYRASGGSASNVLLVERGAAQLGMSVLAVASQAWTGGGNWTSGVKLRGFRALFPIFDSSLQIFAPAGSGISRLADLSGKRVGVGPAGGSGAVLASLVFAATRVSPGVNVAGLYHEQIELLRRGDLDACAFFGVTPLPAIREAARHGGFNLIGFDEDERRAARKAIAGLRDAVVPRSALPALSAAVATVGSSAIAIGRADLPDPLAHAVTEAALSRRTALLRTLPGSRPAPIDAGWVGRGVSVAVHPGAAAALRQHGLDVPADMVRS